VKPKHLDDVEYFARKIKMEKEKMKAILNNIDRIKQEEKKALSCFKQSERI
jgi:hypothetical protein